MVIRISVVKSLLELNQHDAHQCKLNVRNVEKKKCRSARDRTIRSRGQLARVTMYSDVASIACLFCKKPQTRQKLVLCD